MGQFKTHQDEDADDDGDEHHYRRHLFFIQVIGSEKESTE